jgi:hypothetical protein
LVIGLKADSSSWTLEREENSLDDRPENRHAAAGPLKGKKTPLMIDLKTDSSSWNTGRKAASLVDRTKQHTFVAGDPREGSRFS